jgi:hypothetical protein
LVNYETGEGYEKVIEQMEKAINEIEELKNDKK